MTVAASFLSTKAENQSLFVALVQGASVTLVAVETEGTLRTLRLDNPALIYGTWICSLVNLVLSFLVPVLVLRGHINNRKWGTYSNATALFLASSIPTKKELNAARRAGHLAYLQESIQANASEGSGDEAAPDLPRPTTADEPTE
ncbi:hypothetical protein A1F96_10441, partial [Pyrenophora tritici-repentis]